MNKLTPIKENDMENSKKEEYSKSITKNGMTKTIRVREVENGYIVSLTKEGDDDKGDWKYDCKDYISYNNPIKDMEGFKGGDDAEYEAMIGSVNKMFA